MSARITLPHNDWAPRPYQQRAWDYLERGGRHAEIIWPRRSGKDELSLHRTAVAAHERVGNYWHMLPEYGQARKAIWDAVNPHTGLKRIDEAFPASLRRHTRDKEMQIIFHNGSTWQAVGSDRYDMLVGASPAGIVYSEWALSNANARAYLRPIVAENKGWQIFITTPRGRNHAYTTFKAAQEETGAFAQRLDATETGVLTADELAEELRKYQREFGEDYGTAKFQQEYMCSFSAANLGTIVAAEIDRAEKAGRISDDVQYDPEGAPLEVSVDIGRRDASTWWFWQPLVGGYAIVDYDYGFGLDAEEWAERIFKKLRGRKLGHIWLPHDAKAKTFSAKRSAVEIFLQEFGREHVMITPNSSISDRVNAARVLTRRVKFNAKACERGLDGLRSWSYEYDEESKTFSLQPRHDWASHDGDGYSYGCLIMQQVAPPKEETTEPVRGVVQLPNGSFCLGESLNEMWSRQRRASNRV